MIQPTLSRKAGLDSVIKSIVSSSRPLVTLSKEHGHLLHPEEIIILRGRLHSSAAEFVEAMEANREELHNDGFDPHMISALSFLRRDTDYLDRPRSERFPNFRIGGEQRYHVVTPELGGYNPSFAISLFPEETISIDEKEGMVSQVSDPRLGYDYIRTKSILLSYEREGAVSYYIAVVAGNQRVNTKEIGSQLGLSKKESKRIKLANQDPLEIIGREPGAVGPLIEQPKFDRINAVFIAKDLLEGYSNPHYSMPIDKRSALIVSDLNDALSILKEINGYPQIMLYDNRKA